MLTKSTITTSSAFLIFISSFFFEKYDGILSSIGLFALSGSVTNWLAVHMLFEKVPLLYGSGVIPARFLMFKSAIRDLIVTQFFDSKRIESFLVNISPMSNHEFLNSIDYNNIFDELIEAITVSKVGSMLQMIGGAKALEPLREPIISKLDSVVKKLMAQQLTDSKKTNLVKSLTTSIEEMIDARLNELSSEDVKSIVQKMIREHLGWLVVWGGILGGLIGLMVELWAV